MSPAIPSITIPAELRPVDGRFGCGPSKIRPEAMAALAAEPLYMGTSHRQLPVQIMVSRLRNALAELFALPDGYEIMLGNGGSTVFWDIATFGLIERRSQHLSFGEFSSKFAAAAKAAPFLEDPEVLSVDPGSHPDPVANADVDAYCFTHNETSTGVAMPLVRPAGTSPDDSLVLVDATSAAGGLRFDAGQTDVYYFAPQKCLASDGGLWLAAVSPAAIERIERIGDVRPLDPRIAQPHRGAGQLPQGPDLQHAGAGHGAPRHPPGRVDQRERRASTSPPRAATARPRPSTTGPRADRGPPRS